MNQVLLKTKTRDQIVAYTYNAPATKTTLAIQNSQTT